MALLAAALVGAFRLLAPDPEKELAALDATRAVPDEDNAALIYTELVQGEEVPLSNLARNAEAMIAAMVDPVMAQESRNLTRALRALELSVGVPDPNAARDIGTRPWRSAECPELRQWLDNHQSRIDRLLEAARKPACRFPLLSTSGRVGLFDVPTGAFRQNVWLLIWAANNDFGEGETDAALAKCRALTTIGKHLRQQPSRHWLLSGISFEAVALHRLAEFVVEGPATERHLDDLRLRYSKIENEWESICRDITRVQSLYSRLLDDRRSVKWRMVDRFGQFLGGSDPQDERTRELYLRMLSEQRGLRILIELRRFSNRTGRWPARLEEIARLLPPEVLVDPASRRPYVYKLSGQSFSLYSIGPNAIDEGGRHKWDGPDDWPIWPPRGIVSPGSTDGETQ